MVVGSGLLANAFHQYSGDDRVLIFASGVSNSKSENSVDYNRELELIKSYSNFNGLLVYFSTCSIYDPVLKNSVYIKHKILVEDYIRSTHKKFLIVRLPNVVGAGTNPFTLTNFIHNSILSDKKIVIQTRSARYLIHIDDVVAAVSAVISKGSDLNQIANLVLYEKYFVVDILKEFENYLNKKAFVELVDEGASYNVNCDPIFNLSETDLETDPLVALQKMISKSYPVI